jgi:hypothetical protein
MTTRLVPDDLLVILTPLLPPDRPKPRVGVRASRTYSLASWGLTPVYVRSGAINLVLTREPVRGWRPVQVRQRRLRIERVECSGRGVLFHSQGPGRCPGSSDCADRAGAGALQYPRLGFPATRRFCRPQPRAWRTLERSITPERQLADHGRDRGERPSMLGPEPAADRPPHASRRKATAWIATGSQLPSPSTGASPFHDSAYLQPTLTSLPSSSRVTLPWRFFHLPCLLKLSFSSIASPSPDSGPSITAQSARRLLGADQNVSRLLQQYGTQIVSLQTRAQEIVSQLDRYPAVPIWSPGIGPVAFAPITALH